MFIVITFVMVYIYIMKERIIEFLKAENKSSAQLAEEIGVQPSGISHIISGRNNPSLDFVIKMLEKYKFLSSDWLLFGKGDMYREAQMQKLFDDSKISQPIAYSQLEASNRDDGRKNKPIDMAADQKFESERGVTRVVMFYSDSTFMEYLPGNNK
jgi:transcriptional regulator with XRE-family HTH domain